MSSPVTAVLELHDASPAPGAGVLSAVLAPLRGVIDVSVDPAGSVVTVRFDHDLTGIGEIVRLIEDMGAVVASIAPRTSTAGPVAGRLYPHRS
jgi:copper chaperone CopZ